MGILSTDNLFSSKQLTTQLIQSSYNRIRIILQNSIRTFPTDTTSFKGKETLLLFLLLTEEFKSNGSEFLDLIEEIELAFRGLQKNVRISTTSLRFSAECSSVTDYPSFYGGGA